MSRKGKSIEMESRTMVPWSSEWEMGVTANEHKASFRGEKNVLSWGCGGGYTTL